MLLVIKIEQLYENKENRSGKEGHVVRAKIFYTEVTQSQCLTRPMQLQCSTAKSSLKIKTFQQSPIVKDDNSTPSRRPFDHRCITGWLAAHIFQ